MTELATVVWLHGQRVGVVRARDCGFEALTAREATLGLYNTEFAAAKAVLVVAAAFR